MCEEKLLELALTHKEHNCAAYLLTGFAAQYLEGYMDKSKDIFNKNITKASNETLRLMIEDNTFECITKICKELLAIRAKKG